MGLALVAWPVRSARRLREELPLPLPPLLSLLPPPLVGPSLLTQPGLSVCLSEGGYHPPPDLPGILI